MSLKALISSDWFVNAIVKDGSVRQCLAEVMGELSRKKKFIELLSEKLGEDSSTGGDALSKLSARIRMLENTIKFRASILSVDRRGAWFRANATTAAGPFVSALMPEPVFSQYDESTTKNIRIKLLDCWTQKNLVSYPLRATEPCLWKILLALNFELERLGDLGEWGRLEACPEWLPKEFDSRALTAFLTNVKLEYLSARAVLNRCQSILLEASERFWSTAPRQRIFRSGDESYDGQSQAESMRQDFRRRRATADGKRSVMKSALDLQALKLMGFDDFPAAEDLKQRYHALALEMHPDRQGGNEARFKMLSKCYRHLSTR